MITFIITFIISFFIGILLGSFICILLIPVLNLFKTKNKFPFISDRYKLDSDYPGPPNASFHMFPHDWKHPRKAHPVRAFLFP